MSDKKSVKDDLNNINKEINSNKNQIKEQNKKIHELDERLDNLNDKTKVTEKYVSGFSSFFGFFPKLFSWGSKKKKKEEKSYIDNKINIEKNNNKSSGKEKYSEKEIDEMDDLEKEIYFLNRNAKDLKSLVDLNYEGTNQLEKKIDKTNKKVINVKESANKELTGSKEGEKNKK